VATVDQFGQVNKADMYPLIGDDLSRFDDLERIPAFIAATRNRVERSRATRRFPRDVYREMGEHGWVTPLGGSVADGTLTGVERYCSLVEEFSAYGYPSAHYSIQSNLWLSGWGSAEQKALLPPLASGEIIISTGVSEKGVGSSLRSLQTRATKTGSSLRIVGSKTHMTLADEADFIIVFADLEEAGLTAIVVPTGLAGIDITVTRPANGGSINTADVVIDVEIPISAILGQPGGGLRMLTSVLDVSRVGNASELIGFARCALDNAIQLASSTTVGETRVIDFQGNRWAVSRMFEKLWSASLARDWACRSLTTPQARYASGLAKLAALEAAEYICNGVFGIVGGEGLYPEHPFVRLLFETKVLRSAGGSAELLRDQLSRHIVDEGILRAFPAAQQSEDTHREADLV